MTEFTLLRFAGFAESNGMSLVLLLRKMLGMWNRLGSTGNAVLGLRACLAEILIFYPFEFDCSFVFESGCETIGSDDSIHNLRLFLYLS